MARMYNGKAWIPRNSERLEPRVTPVIYSAASGLAAMAFHRLGLVDACGHSYRWMAGFSGPGGWQAEGQADDGTPIMTLVGRMSWAPFPTHDQLARISMLADELGRGHETCAIVIVSDEPGYVIRVAARRRFDGTDYGIGIDGRLELSEKKDDDELSGMFHTVRLYRLFGPARSFEGDQLIDPWLEPARNGLEWSLIDSITAEQGWPNE